MRLENGQQNGPSECSRNADVSTDDSSDKIRNEYITGSVKMTRLSELNTGLSGFGALSSIRNEMQEFKDNGQKETSMTKN